MLSVSLKNHQWWMKFHGIFYTLYHSVLGGKRGHKGGRKQFSNPQALEAAKAKEEKEKEWRRARGEVVTDTYVFTRFFIQKK